VPYAKYPEILKRLEPEIGEGLSLANWDEAVAEEAFCLSQPLQGHTEVDGVGYIKVPFKPTAEQLAELEVVEIAQWRGCPKEKRALNVKLWDQLAADALKRKAEREENLAANRAKSGKPAKASASSSSSSTRRSALGGHGSPRPSPAAVLKNRMAAWKTRWESYLIDKELATYPQNGSPGHQATALLAILHLAASGAERSMFSTSNVFREVLKDHGQRDGLVDLLGGFGGYDPGDLIVLAIDVTRRMVWSKKDGPVEGGFPHQAIAAMAENLDIDLAAAWRAELGGPLTEEFFNHHTREQLADLAKHYGVDVADCQTKAATALALRSADRVKLKLPPGLAPKKAKAAKPKAAKGAKAKKV
jgi:hypothetical protein